MKTIAGSAYIFAIFRLDFCWITVVEEKAFVFENILTQMENVFLFPDASTRIHLDLMYTSMLLTKNPLLFSRAVQYYASVHRL